MAAAVLATASVAQSGLPVGHASWDRVLKRYTKAGLVDYAKLKSEPTALDGYLASLAALKASDYAA